MRSHQDLMVGENVSEGLSVTVKGKTKGRVVEQLAFMLEFHTQKG